MTQDMVNKLIPRQVLMELESPVCDIANVARIASDYIGNLLLTMKENGTLNPNQADAAGYMLVHVEKVADKIRDDLYVALEVER